MIISHSKKFVFIHLDKCGGTSIEKSLAPHLKPYDMYFGDEERLFFGKGDGLSKHATAGVTSRYLDDLWNQYYKFAIVREPVQLMKSFYAYAEYMLYRPCSCGNCRGNGFLKAFEDSQIDGTGPDGFVSKMFKSNYQSVWPQTVRLRELLENDGTVIDLSSLKMQWSNLTERLGFDQPIFLKHINKTNSQAVEFTEETINKIHLRFAVDYKVLPLYTSVYW